jgi:hypothetical protein
MLGCAAPDPRTVEGTLELLAAAADAGDAQAVYPLLDRRARAALNSIVLDRQRAARMIRAEYPPQERAPALAALGDALDAADPAILFARRCPPSCLREIAVRLGAPAQVRNAGPELEVTTQRGTTLRLFRDRERRVGLVWRTAELDRERLQANRELAQIAHNAEVYRRRRTLEAAASP